LDLSGKLLIAMPGMGDMRFDRSVIFLCAHTGEGAMGLIVNKPAPELSFRALLDQMSIPASDRSRDIRVHFGGPVEHGRGFVLHSPDYEGSESTLQVDGRFKLTATSDILEAMASGTGPNASLFALGYAGWGPGQLEAEIRRNGWLVADATPELVFSDDNPGKWRGALKVLGIDPLALSPSAGHA
jgi:putative transcriptional regulator